MTGFEGTGGTNARTPAGFKHKVEGHVGAVHDLCPCGRRDPRTLSRGELARHAADYRSVERAAARLRLVTDGRLHRPTPGAVMDLANEHGDLT
jgi:hypothetical protein